MALPWPAATVSHERDAGAKRTGQEPAERAVTDATPERGDGDRSGPQPKAEASWKQIRPSGQCGITAEGPREP